MRWAKESKDLKIKMNYSQEYIDALEREIKCLHMERIQMLESSNEEKYKEEAQMIKRKLEQEKESKNAWIEMYNKAKEEI